MVGLPSMFDWRDQNKVAPVGDFSKSGIPAVFATIGAVESATAISRNKDLVPLSTQQVLDCSKITFKSVLPSEIYNYLVKQGGVMSAAKYPYKTGIDKCVYNESNSDTKVVSR